MNAQETLEIVNWMRRRARASKAGDINKPHKVLSGGEVSLNYWAGFSLFRCIVLCLRSSRNIASSDWPGEKGGCHSRT